MWRYYTGYFFYRLPEHGNFIVYKHFIPAITVALMDTTEDNVSDSWPFDIMQQNNYSYSSYNFQFYRLLHLNYFIKTFKMVMPPWHWNCVTATTFRISLTKIIVCVVIRMTDWLVDWLTDRLTDRPKDWPTSRLTEGLMDWLPDRPIDRLTNRLTEGLMDALTDRPNGRRAIMDLSWVPLVAIRLYDPFRYSVYTYCILYGV
jgi:hypothetical protein